MVSDCRIVILVMMKQKRIILKEKTGKVFRKEGFL